MLKRSFRCNLCGKKYPFIIFLKEAIFTRIEADEVRVRSHKQHTERKTNRNNKTCVS